MDTSSFKGYCFCKNLKKFSYKFGLSCIIEPLSTIVNFINYKYGVGSILGGVLGSFNFCNKLV